MQEKTTYPGKEKWFNSGLLTSNMLNENFILPCKHLYDIPNENRTYGSSARLNHKCMKF